MTEIGQGSDSAARWDEHYAKGEHSAHAGSERRSELADFVPQLALPKQPRRAMDVGCGTGEDARWLAGAGFQAVGVDLSVNALKAAAARTPAGTDVQWLVGDAGALPAEDASCVLVTDRGCLHHVAPDDVPAYVAEVARVLAPGGAWVIRDMIGHSGQHRELDPQSIRDLAVGSELEVESCQISGAAHASGLLAVLRRA